MDIKRNDLFRATAKPFSYKKISHINTMLFLQSNTVTITVFHKPFTISMAIKYEGYFMKNNRLSIKIDDQSIDTTHCLFEK